VSKMMQCRDCGAGLVVSGGINGRCPSCYANGYFPGAMWKDHGIMVSKDTRDRANSPATELRTGLPLKRIPGSDLYIDCPAGEAECILSGRRPFTLIGDEPYAPVDTPAMALFLTPNGKVILDWIARMALVSIFREQPESSPGAGGIAAPTAVCPEPPAPPTILEKE